jgi:transcription initiation factor TFIID subunit TAF12
MSGKSGAAEASKMIASILSRSEGSARRTAQVLAEARLSSAALGAQLSNVLRPVGKQLQHHQQQQQQQQQHQQQQEQRHHDEDNSRFSSRECEVFSAFWEHTGVVMLEPEVPKPDELVQVGKETFKKNEISCSLF